MKCPYCCSSATRVRTPIVDQDYLWVAEGDNAEGWDFDISMYQCDSTKDHIFYADDCQGNDQSNLPEVKLDDQE